MKTKSFQEYLEKRLDHGEILQIKREAYMELIKDSEALTTLRESLLFLHVAELRALATQLGIPETGNKRVLIMRVLHFLATGEIITQPPYPKASCAPRGKQHSLESNALMLKGAYKNDLKTRLFFKKLIGKHFHFTAFGIDWLEERWQAGNPPTYAEFAIMWQGEYERRKAHPTAPKEEWAYINFVQAYLQLHPDTTQKNILATWQTERQKHKQRVDMVIKKLLV